MMMTDTNSRIFTREQIEAQAAVESRLDRAIAGSLEASRRMVDECRTTAELERLARKRRPTEAE